MAFFTGIGNQYISIYEIILKLVLPLLIRADSNVYLCQKNIYAYPE